MSTEVESVLNLLEDLRGKSQVQTYLEESGVPYSGTWATLRTRVRKGMQVDKVDTDGLIRLLEEIEEHGAQYVFLYRIRKNQKDITTDSIEKDMTDGERKSVLNTVRIIEEPSERASLVSCRVIENQHPHRETEVPTLAALRDPVKLKWVQKRVLHRHIGETVKDNRLTVEYDLEPARAVDVAIVSGKDQRAYLCVQRVETGLREYKDHVKSMKERLSRFMDPEALEEVDLGKVMKKLADQAFSEVRRRRHHMRDRSGAVLDATSATETDDVFTSGLYMAARQNYSGPLSTLHANVYWLPNGEELKREIHTLFPYHSFPNAIVFTQRCSRSERDYVVSRVEELA